VRNGLQSNDEVSAVLTPLFVKAVPHREEELQRAKQRKERGQPPGKKAGPIGDQLTWEQILARFVGRKRLWIITRDSDYGTIYEGRGFLNQFLYEELRKEAFLFDNVAKGIKHFAAITGVADHLPSPEKIEEITKEEDTLPRILDSWMVDDNAAMTAIRAAQMRQRAALLGDWVSGPPLPPTSELPKPTESS